MDPKQVINGTWGEVWLEGNRIAEVYGLQAKVDVDKEAINMCGTLMTGKKMRQLEGTGSLKVWKMDDSFARLTSSVRTGRSQSLTIISKLDDPDAKQAERVSLMGVSFDTITLADWEAAVVGKLELPFTFFDYEFLD